jgi:tetratricopeptide (TPR) repeat protein
VTYLQEHGYDANHPWVVKFDIEDSISEMQRLVDEDEFDGANEIIEKLSSGSSVRGGSVAFLSPSQRFIILECRVRAIIGKTRNLMWRGQYAEAEQLITDGMSTVISKTVSTENPLLAQALKLIGDVRVLRAEFASAKENYLKAMQLLTDLLGPDSIMLVEVMIALADLSRQQALYAEAEALYTQSMHILIAEIQKDPSPQPKPNAEAPCLYARALLGISELFIIKNQFDAASSTLEQCRLVCAGMTGSNIVYHALYLELIGLLSVEKGELDAAADLYEQSIRLYSTAFNDSGSAGSRPASPVNNAAVYKHPNIGRIMTRQALIAFLKSEYANCQQLCDDAGLILSSNFDVKHEPMLQLTYLRAQSALRLGEYETSKQQLVEVLNIARKLFGGRHPFVGALMCAIADNLLIRGEAHEAQLLYDDSKKLCQELFDADGWNYHTSIAAALLGIARCALLVGLSAEALPTVTDCLQIHKHLCAKLEIEQSLLSAETHCVHASVCLKQCKLKEAKQSLTIAVDTLYAKLGQNSALVAECLFVLGQLLCLEGRHKDARTALSYCLCIRIRIFGLNHVEVFQTLSFAAENIRSAGYFADALCAVTTAINGFTNIFTKNSVYVYLANTVKAKILHNTKKFGDAEILFRELGSNIKAYCGEVNEHFLEVTIGLAESARLQKAKIAHATSKYKEALQLATSLFPNPPPSPEDRSAYFSTDTSNNGNQFHVCTLDIRCAQTMITFATQPNKSRAECIKLLMDDIVPKYVQLFGNETHPKILFAKGRLGLLLDDKEPGDGDRVRDRAMMYFAGPLFVTTAEQDSNLVTNNQLFYPADHPWVTELEGYRAKTKFEGLKPRTSSTNVELALESWCVPQFKSFISNYSTMTTIFVDTLVSVAFQGKLASWNAMNNATSSNFRNEPEYRAMYLRIFDPEYTEPSLTDEAPSVQQQLANLATGDAKAPAAEPEPALAPVPVSVPQPEPVVEDASAVLKVDDTPFVEEALTRMEARAESQVQSTVDDAAVVPTTASRDAPVVPTVVVDDTSEVRLSNEEPQTVLSARVAEAVAAPALVAPDESTTSMIEDFRNTIAVTARELVNKIQQEASERYEAGNISAAVVTSEVLKVEDKTAEVPKEVPATQILQEEEEDVPKFEKFVPQVVARAVVAAPVEAAAEASSKSIDPSQFLQTNYTSLPASDQNDLYAANFMYVRAQSLMNETFAYKKSLPLLEECLAVRERLLPKEQLTVETKFELAKCCYKLCLWDQSVEYFKSCVDMQSRFGAEGGSDGSLSAKNDAFEFSGKGPTTVSPVVEFCNNLLSVRYKIGWVKVLMATGKYFAADELISQMMHTLTTSQANRPTAEPPANIPTMDSKSQLKYINVLWTVVYQVAAFNFINIDSLWKAKGFAEKCYEQTNNVFGNRGVEITNSFLCSARAFIAVGNLTDAKPLIEQALIIRKNKLGSKHPKVAQCLSMFGDCFLSQGVFADADSRYLQAIETAAGSSGAANADHGDPNIFIADCMFQRGLINCHQGRYPEAAAEFKRVQEIRTKIFGEISLPVAECLQALAQCHFGMCQFVKAKDVIQQAISMKTEVLGQSGAMHSLVAHATLLLAEIERKLCHFNECLSLYNAVADCYLNVYTKNSLYYAKCEDGLADLSADKCDYDGAIRIYERVLAVKKGMYSL